MRTLVIGGTGLISRHITRQLVSDGHDVTVYNRGRTGGAKTSVRQLVGNRAHHGEFVRQLRDEAPFDCVIDMICFKGSDAQSLVDAFAGRVGQLIVCSTVEVFGAADRFPITEATPRRAAPTPSGEPWIYAQRKIDVEEVLERHFDEHGDFPLTVIRPGHTYGDRGQLHFPLGSEDHFRGYFARLLRRLPIVVHGDGNSVWAPCAAEDVAAAFVAAAGHQAAIGRSYNVPGLDSMTWDRYVQAIAAGIGAPEPELVHIPLDVLRRIVPPERVASCVIAFQYCDVFDTSAAQTDLGFRCTVPLEVGAARIHEVLQAEGAFDDALPPDPLDDAVVEAWSAVPAARQ
jgi:nucleoside-diphosphate-sugar epimerase